MAGRPGRSGGHNKLSLEAHVLRGTLNPTRHRKLIAPGGPVWQPTSADLKQIGADGRAFIARLQAVYELSPLEGELAIEGAVAVDRLQEIRGRRPACPEDERRALDKLELAWQRALSTCLLSLRVRL